MCHSPLNPGGDTGAGDMAEQVAAGGAKALGRGGRLLTRLAPLVSMVNPVLGASMAQAGKAR